MARHFYDERRGGESTVPSSEIESAATASTPSKSAEMEAARKFAALGAAIALSSYMAILVTVFLSVPPCQHHVSPSYLWIGSTDFIGDMCFSPATYVLFVGLWMFPLPLAAVFMAVAMMLSRRGRPRLTVALLGLAAVVMVPVVAILGLAAVLGLAAGVTVPAPKVVWAFTAYLLLGMVLVAFRNANHSLNVQGSTIRLCFRELVSLTGWVPSPLSPAHSHLHGLK